MAFSGLVPFAFLCVMGPALTHPTQAQNSPQDFVDAHNAGWQEVSVSPLTWDSNVEAYDRDYANQRSGDCQLEHSVSEQCGENLSIGSGAPFTVTDAVNDWVKQQNDYGYNTNSCGPEKVCEYYTQVVSRDSVRLGCARVECNNGGIFITCKYDSAGNIDGKKPY